MWTEFVQSLKPSDNRAWADRRYWANVAWLGAPPPPGTPVQIHDFNGQPRVLAADGAPLGTLQAALNPARTGLARAQASQQVGRIDISYLGPDDLSATAAA
jgi:hypothetical protein